MNVDKITVKTNPWLFEQWRNSVDNLERVISNIKSLSGIVQNDMEISKESLLDFKNDFQRILQELDAAAVQAKTDLSKVYFSTIDHISQCTLGKK